MISIRFNKTLVSVLVLILVGVFAGAVNFALATTAESASGWGWGGGVTVNPAGYEGMGWISFNDTTQNSGGGTYGVNIPASDGALSGYAWNDNYGWISFNAADVVGCVSGGIPTPGPSRVGNSLAGAARILAIKDAMNAVPNNAGGYDGCIDLSGVTIAGNTLNGHMWSSDLGWIDVTGVVFYFAPTAEIIDPLPALPGDPVVLTYGLNLTFDGQARDAANQIMNNAQLQFQWQLGQCNQFGRQYHNQKQFATSTVGNAIMGNGATETVYLRVRDTVSGLWSTNCPSVDIVINCAAGAHWNGVACVTPSVSFNASGCAIPIGGTQCNGSVSWDFNDVQAPENYLVENISRGLTIGNTEDSGGLIQTVLQQGENILKASANGVSEERRVTAACDGGGGWYNGVCTAPPAITLIPTPDLIRSGQQANIDLRITANYDMSCMIHGANLTPISFTHFANVAEQSYPQTTRQLTAAQMVRVTCVTPWGADAIAETRISVLPTIQEN